MRGWLFALLIALPGAAQADEANWVPLSGAEIAEALTGHTLDYSGA